MDEDGDAPTARHSRSSGHAQRAAEAVWWAVQGSPARRLMGNRWSRAVRRHLARRGPGDRLFRDGDLTFEAPGDVAGWYAQHPFEPLLVDWLRSQLRRGHTAVDVGANVGLATVRMAQLVGPAGRVVAVEPFEDNLRCLRRNLRRHHLEQVVVVPVAAGSDHRQRDFRLGSTTATHGFFEHPQGSSGTVVRVTQAPLDELVGDPVDLVKIDVEGAELEVLGGMERILSFNPGLRLSVEWNPACLATAGEEAVALPRRLQALGFSLEVLDDCGFDAGFGTVRSVEQVLAALDAGALHPHWYGNLACTPTTVTSV